MIVGSIDGLLCFYGLYQDIELETWMVVIWNPSVRKYGGIVVPNVLKLEVGYTRIGFGVCPDTNGPKLVKINLFKSRYWEVQVFTLSSRVWKTVYAGAPFKSCRLLWDHVFIDGLIYWWGRGSFIILFDLKSEKFGEVCLPEKLGISSGVPVKVNESLGLLEYYYEDGEMFVCGVWIRKDGVNKPFTKIYTVKVEGKLVLGFRNNGEVVIERDDDDFEGSQIEIYEPSSGRINTVGISGYRNTYTACSYMETLLLLDESISIIH